MSSEHGSKSQASSGARSAAASPPRGGGRSTLATMTMPSGESTVGTMDGRAVARSVSRAWRSPVGDVAPALLLLVLVVAADYRAPLPQLILEAAFVGPRRLRRRVRLLRLAVMRVPMAAGCSVWGWGRHRRSFRALAGLR